MTMVANRLPGVAADPLRLPPSTLRRRGKLLEFLEQHPHLLPVHQDVPLSVLSYRVEFLAVRNKLDVESGSRARIQPEGHGDSMRSITVSVSPLVLTCALVFTTSTLVAGEDLIGHWKLDGRAEEALAADSSGGGHDATVSGTVALS